MKNILLKICHKRKRIPEDRIFLVLLVIFGCVCLTLTGGWHVYTDPVKAGGGKVLAKLGIELPELVLLEFPWDKEDWLAVADKGKQNKQDMEPSMPEADVSANVLEQVTQPEPESETGTQSEPWVPVFQTVEDDYFNDAVFIGDSRTVGMYEYSSLKETSTFYASTGLSVHKLFTAKIVEVPGQHGKITVEQALSEKQFSKVYFMIGINEMGTGTVESFLEKYAESVRRMRELQPDAIIYLQGIMQVSESRSAQGDHITNEAIAIRNEGIKELADDETIFYLEVNEAVCDENGALCAEYTGDGVHLKAQYVDLWKEYLKNHAIIKP